MRRDTEYTCRNELLWAGTNKIIIAHIRVDDILISNRIGKQLDEKNWLKERIELIDGTIFESVAGKFARE